MAARWFLLGDIHGDVAPIEYFYRQNRERLHLDEGENYMILLGDVGVNYALVGNRDRHFKNELSRLPFTYICLRGNHEARVTKVMARDPKSWEMQEKYGGTIYVEKDFPRIQFLSDVPAVYDFDGVKTLSLPGAYSVDKWIRLARGWQWFEDEQLSEEEIDTAWEMIEKLDAVDLVISHTCPLIYEPTDLFLRTIDQSAVDKTMERFLNRVEATLDYKRWAFGHYHADRLYPWNQGRQVMMLFNEKVIDVAKFMAMCRQDALEDIMA